MNNWKQTMNEINFNGKTDVLARIKADQQKKKSLLQLISEFLNYEVSIPLVPVTAALVLSVMIFSFSPKNIPSSNTTYTITVVNQWGHYENY